MATHAICREQEWLLDDKMVPTINYHRQCKKTKKKHQRIQDVIKKVLGSEWLINSTVGKNRWSGSLIYFNEAIKRTGSLQKYHRLDDLKDALSGQIQHAEFRVDILRELVNLSESGYCDVDEVVPTGCLVFQSSACRLIGYDGGNKRLAVRQRMKRHRYRLSYRPGVVLSQTLVVRWLCQLRQRQLRWIWGVYINGGLIF